MWKKNLHDSFWHLYTVREEMRGTVHCGHRLFYYHTISNELPPPGKICLLCFFKNLPGKWELHPVAPPLLPSPEEA